MKDLEKTHLGGDARFDELMKRLRETGVGQSVSASEWNEVEEFINRSFSEWTAHNKIEYDKGFEDGHEKGVEQTYEIAFTRGSESEKKSIKDELLNRAAVEFKVGKDDIAKTLRDLANEIEIKVI